jgi:hypothetical protein
MRKGVIAAAAALILAAGPAGATGPYYGVVVGTNSTLVYPGGKASYWIEINNNSTSLVCLSFDAAATTDPTYQCRSDEVPLRPSETRTWGSPTFSSSTREPKLAGTVAGASIFAILCYNCSGTITLTVGTR